MKELDHEMKKSANCCTNNSYSSEKHNKQSKRPARLLPLQLLFDRDEDEDDTTKKPPPPKFYGPPTNCLVNQGYSLNGFYLDKNPLVDATFQKTTRVETVYCAFKQEGTYNPLNVQ